MHRNIIDSSVKRRCVEMFNSGKTSGEIYKEYFSQIYDGQALESFRVSLKRWRKKTFADNATLDAGTYQGFIAHGATVQVNGNGEIIQAWVKQNAEEQQFEELINAIKENTTPEAVEMVKWNDSGGMLEIPLFDMHFPLSDHKQTLAELLGIIEKQHWQDP